MDVLRRKSLITLLGALALMLFMTFVQTGAATADTTPAPVSTAGTSAITNPNTDETDPATFANGLTFDQCVGQAVQLPGCGTKPTQAGDRGGALQLTLFGLMTGGMLLIAWRISRAVRQRDRVLNTDG